MAGLCELFSSLYTYMSLASSALGQKAPPPSVTLLTRDGCCHAQRHHDIDQNSGSTTALQSPGFKKTPSSIDVSAPRPALPRQAVRLPCARPLLHANTHAHKHAKGSTAGSTSEMHLSTCTGHMAESPSTTKRANQKSQARPKEPSSCEQND